MARTSFEAIASPGDRLRAALYDFFIFSAMGSVLLTAFVGVSGRDPLEDGGALLITAVGLVLLNAIYEVPATTLTGQTIGKRSSDCE